MKTRLKNFAESMGITVNALCRQCGINQSSLSNSKHNSLSSPSLAKISKRYPNLNLRWLLLGEGPMLINCVNPEKNISGFASEIISFIVTKTTQYEQGKT